MANLQQSSCNCKKSNHKSSSGLKTDSIVHTLGVPLCQGHNKTTQLTDKGRLLSRARRKWLSSNMALSFIDYVKNPFNKLPTDVERARLKKSLWNWYYCASAIVMEGDKLTTKYCDSRLCLVCCSIRQARLIRKYQPIIDEWNEGQFVTLTLVSVKADALRDRVGYMNSVFTKIKNKYYGKGLRGTGEAFVGIKKIEITYNDKMDTYHCHFHILVKTRSMAVNLRDEWLNRTAHLNTSIKGQDIRPITKGSGMELFKYATKIVSKVDNLTDTVYHNLVILNALKHKKSIRHFGFKVEDVNDDIDDISADVVGEDMYDCDRPMYDVFNWVDTNWYSITTGLPLTEHRPTTKCLEYMEAFSGEP